MMSIHRGSIAIIGINSDCSLRLVARLSNVIMRPRQYHLVWVTLFGHTEISHIKIAEIFFQG